MAPISPTQRNWQAQGDLNPPVELTFWGIATRSVRASWISWAVRHDLADMALPGGGLARSEGWAWVAPEGAFVRGQSELCNVPTIRSQDPETRK